jgi:Tfp pilus assembly protein PilN
MVPQIDFLPATYHVQRQREHKTLWRRMMVLFFLTLAVLGTSQQRLLQTKLEARRDELRARAEGLQQSLPVEAKLDQQLRELETRAQLLTSLEFRIPTTRLFAALTNSLPEFVSLSECQAEIGLIEGAATANTPITMPNTNKEKVPPFDADLNELKAATARTTTLLTLNGFAPDDSAISRYLVQLKETGLFERVTLAFSGQHRVRDESLRTFQVRVQVKSPSMLFDSFPTKGNERKTEDRRTTRFVSPETDREALNGRRDVAPMNSDAPSGLSFPGLSPTQGVALDWPSIAPLGIKAEQAQLQDSLFGLVNRSSPKLLATTMSSPFADEEAAP